MKLFTACLGVVLSLPPGSRAAAPARPLADAVNIFMGTNNEGSQLSRGNQYPAVHTPFGMNAWSVGTSDLMTSWFYDYKDDGITGIKLTHQPTVWGDDFGALDIMPLTGEVSANYRYRKSPYRRENEVAHPYYYKNHLDKYNTTFELVPSERGAIFRFAFPERVKAFIVLHGAGFEGAKVRQDGLRAVEGEIENGGTRLYFRAELSRDIASLETKHMLAGIGLADGSDPVLMKIASSYVSAAQARDNLALELERHTLESLRDETKEKWERALGAIVVSGGKPAERVTFYSALYRVLAFPKTHWEPVARDGKRAQYHSPFDGKVHLDRKLWTGNGFWDSYRGVWPLLTILFPDLTGEMLDGWVNSYKDGGWTVRWSKPGYWESMIGTHTDIIFADAYLKGIRNWDFQTGYEASVKNAMVPGGREGKGRRFLERSAFLGYVPWTGGGVDDEVGSRTMEDCVNDFGISLLARALGHEDDARYFKNRAYGYANLWDAKHRHFRAKTATGEWSTSDKDFDPFAWRYAWTEGNAWHYRFAPMHDAAGLVSLFGGNAGLEAALDEVFKADTHFEVGGYGMVIHEMTEAKLVGDKGFGQFAIANEPVHHMAHMFTYAGRPSKTQYWVRRAVTELYESGEGNGRGYPGDEDEGQMSAWYVMNAMGIYSAAPGYAEYVMTSPIFDSVKIGKFEIATHGKGWYIGGATLDGVKHDRPFLAHAAIAKGGKLALEMVEKSNGWGESAAVAPVAPRYVARIPVKSLSGSAGVKNLTDDNSLTWWAGAGTATAELEKPATANCHTLTSADDPAALTLTWKLSASPDGQSWTTLDEHRGVAWRDRRETKLFCFANTTAYARYRLEVSGPLAEWELRELR